MGFTSIASGTRGVLLAAAVGRSSAQDRWMRGFMLRSAGRFWIGATQNQSDVFQVPRSKCFGLNVHPSPAQDPLFRGERNYMPQSILARMSRARVLRKCVGKPFVLMNEWAWNRLPFVLMATRPMCIYGTFLHSLVALRSARRQSHGTFFLRNRPELQLMRTLLDQRTKGSTLRLAVLACSNGAEVYSVLWTIRSARPDLKIVVNAIDISNEILAIAKKGLYSLRTNELMDSTAIFARLTEEEIRAMFDREKDHLRIKSWIKEGINWQVADAGDPELARLLGPQDIVVANRFLCHMAPPDAERCLRNMAHLVNPGGYLFVSGIDLDIRTKVALDLGWTPVPDLAEEIHNGDPSLRGDWPWKYWGLEPFTRKRRDWSVRYASVFQLGQTRRDAKPPFVAANV